MAKKAVKKMVEEEKPISSSEEEAHGGATNPSQPPLSREEIETGFKKILEAVDNINKRLVLVEKKPELVQTIDEGKKQQVMGDLAGKIISQFVGGSSESSFETRLKDTVFEKWLSRSVAPLIPSKKEARKWAKRND
jgi:hypothetical protein